MFVVKLAAVLNASPGSTPAKPLRIERQKILQTLERIEHYHADDAEEQHRDGIFDPGLLRRRVDTAQPVNQPLDRQQHGIQKRALAGKHARHVEPQRHADQSDDSTKRSRFE